MARSNGVNTAFTWDGDSRLTALSEGVISSLELTHSGKGEAVGAADSRLTRLLRCRDSLTMDLAASPMMVSEFMPGTLLRG